ncbi:hypothetical protein [Desulfonema ishimotonii]|uniref:hypothetical protein n=1 Tax=Desulfonema ishimotonii TaxID=45657 RepID=UPI000F561DEB|nr:hypothetical protein [Desulfonema ishimotonii]
MTGEIRRSTPGVQVLLAGLAIVLSLCAPLSGAETSSSQKLQLGEALVLELSAVTSREIAAMPPESLAAFQEKALQAAALSRDLAASALRSGAVGLAEKAVGIAKSVFKLTVNIFESGKYNKTAAVIQMAVKADSLASGAVRIASQLARQTEDPRLATAVSDAIVSSGDAVYRLTLAAEDNGEPALAGEMAKAAGDNFRIVNGLSPVIMNTEVFPLMEATLRAVRANTRVISASAAFAKAAGNKTLGQIVLDESADIQKMLSQMSAAARDKVATGTSVGIVSRFQALSDGLQDAEQLNRTAFSVALASGATPARPVQKREKHRFQWKEPPLDDHRVASPI